MIIPISAGCIPGIRLVIITSPKLSTIRRTEDSYVTSYVRYVSKNYKGLKNTWHMAAASAPATATTLTAKESAWTASLRGALAVDDALTVEESAYVAAHVSTLSLAQYAIVSKGDNAKALKRIKTMAKTWHTLKLDEVDVEEALNYLLAKCPTMILAAAHNSDGVGVWLMRYRDFVPADFKGVEEWRSFTKLFVSIMDALMCDLDAVRSGLLMVCDCAGMGWSNFDRELEERGTEIFQDGYPMKIHGMILVDSPWWMKVRLRVRTLSRPGSQVHCPFSARALSLSLSLSLFLSLSLSYHVSRGTLSLSLSLSSPVFSYDFSDMYLRKRPFSRSRDFS